MHACMKCKLTLIKKRNKHIIYLHITHNKPKLSNEISTLISSSRVFNGEFLFLGLLTWFHLSIGDNKIDICKKTLKTMQTSSNSFK